MQFLTTRQGIVCSLLLVLSLGTSRETRPGEGGFALRSLLPPGARHAALRRAVMGARRRLERVPRAIVGLTRLLPGHGFPSAARVGRRLLRALSGGGAIEAQPRPFRVVFSDCPLATLDALGTGCSLYTGALETLVRGYSGRETKIVHEDCRARGGAACVWTQAPESVAAEAAA